MKRGWLNAGIIGVGLVFLARGSGSAQEARNALPASIAAEVTRMLNDSATDVRIGDLELSAGRHLGDLAVIDGDLSLSGVVDGDVAVVNGDLYLLEGAEVTGAVMVVGGEVANIAGARVGGEIASYRGSYVYERVGEVYREIGGSAGAGVRVARQGRSDFLITTGKSYNRVEGLPIAFGPRLETESSNPLRLEALGVYRTETGLTFEPEQMGYYVRADQFIGGHREFRVGAALFSVVDPIEEWHLTDLETGLATFLFHRDFRDHFERTGWNVNTGWDLPNLPLLLAVEARWERHELRSTGSPWSLFRNAEPWRPQPLVAEGRLGSLVGQATYDSRSSSWNPSNGWLIRAQLEHAFNVDVARPEVAPFEPESPVTIPSAPDYGRFLHGLVDLRSYNRVDADSRLNVRIVAGGSLTGDPLPPQRQHALGGEGSLPGYSLFSRDCGARSSSVTFVDAAGGQGAVPFFANYGCDAFGLIQAEFRGKLSFRFRWDGGPWRDDDDGDDPGLDLDWDMSPDWAIFVDAGRGWTFQDDRPNEDTHVDVGVGLLLERFGIYLAVPVTSGSGANLFVRLGPRF